VEAQLIKTTKLAGGYNKDYMFKGMRSHQGTRC